VVPAALGLKERSKHKATEPFAIEKPPGSQAQREPSEVAGSRLTEVRKGQELQRSFKK
jgi:hypothetical protein